MPGVTRARLSATSVSALIAMPGAISTISEACPSSGRKPWATVCRKPASCGCRTSMKVRARSSMSGGAKDTLPSPTSGRGDLSRRAFGRETELVAGVILDLAEPAHFDLPDALARQVQNRADLL